MKTLLLPALILAAFLDASSSPPSAEGRTIKDVSPADLAKIDQPQVLQKFAGLPD